jgi:hypothetical protein
METTKTVMKYLFFMWIAAMMAIITSSTAVIVYYTFCNEFYALS